MSIVVGAAGVLWRDQVLAILSDACPSFLRISEMEPADRG